MLGDRSGLSGPSPFRCVRRIRRAHGINPWRCFSMVPHLFHRETTHPTRQGNPLLGGTLHIAGTTRCISTSTGQTSCSSPPLQALSLMIVALSTTNERERTPPVWLRPEGMQAWFCVPDQRGPTDETDSLLGPNGRPLIVRKRNSASRTSPALSQKV